MIIKLKLSKDTYITNLNTKNSEGINANTGHAATLDLFKLYNENRYCRSKAYIVFDDSEAKVNNNDVIFFTDSDGKELKLKFKTDTQDSSWDADNIFYEIGMLSADGVNTIEIDKYSEKIGTIINTLNDLGSIKLKCYFSGLNLVVEQNSKGESGDQKFDISAMTAASSRVSPDSQGQHYFARIEYSYVLLKLDKDEILKWVPNDEIGAFTSGDYSVILELKDVSTGLSKPKEYQLEYYELNKDFNEGIGRDTVSYSDSESCNFVNLNNSESWDIQGFISDGDIVSSTSGLSNYIELGDEDIKIDITNYVSKLILNNNYVNKGIVIGFKEEYIFNKKSYFVKRLGSRHLLNKTLTPRVDIIIDDTKYDYSDYDIKKREFKISESSFKLYYLDYLNTGVRFKITEETDPDNIVEIIAETDLVQEIDFKGNDINALLSYEVILSNGENGENFLDPEYVNFATNNNGKKSFKISWLKPDSSLIQKEDINIVYYDYDSKTSLQDIYVSINFDRELTANNADYLMSVYFISLKEKISSSREVFNLKSKNLGSVYYDIVDDSGKILVEKNSIGTKLKFNGENYIGRVFMSDLFKNQTLKIRLYYDDSFGTLRSFENSVTFKVN